MLGIASMATFVCVCGAVNIDFITSPSLCLSVAGAQRGWVGGDLVHTLSKTQQSPDMGRGVFTFRYPNMVKFFGFEWFTV